MKKIRHNWFVRYLCVTFCCCLFFVFARAGVCEFPWSVFADTTGCGYGVISSEPGPLSPYDGVKISEVIGALFILAASVAYLMFALPKLFRLRLESESESNYH